MFCEMDTCCAQENDETLVGTKEALPPSHI